MTRLLLALALLLGTTFAAPAAVSRAQLAAQVFVDAKSGAALPLALSLRDETGQPLTLGEAIGGKPAVVVFADYTCRNICGPVVAFAAGGLAKTGLVPGRDFHLVVVGLDAKDTLADARAMKAAHVGADSPIATATLMLSGEPAAVRALTAAAGYHYAYDRDNDQFAHPAVAYVVGADGRIARILSGLALDAADLRLALVEAGQGRVGTLADRVHLFCYGYDPATGVYSASIARIMLGAGIFTVIALAGGLALLSLRRRASP